MSNTIDEALEWLCQATGETWTASTLLKRILWIGSRQRTNRGTFSLPLKAAPPIDTKFGLYRCNAPDHPFFVRLWGSEWQMVTLWAPQIEQLLHLGETTVSLAEQPEDGPQPGRHYVFIEPLDAPQHITMSMVRIPDTVLHALAHRVNNADVQTKEDPVSEGAPSLLAPLPESTTADPANIRSREPLAVIAANGASMDHDATPVSANALSIAENLTPWDKGGEARSKKMRTVGDYALQLANEGNYRSRRQAVKAIAPAVRKYAKEESGVDLSEDRLEKTIDEWLSARDYKSGG